MPQITYCGNVHPTRTLDDLLAHLHGPCAQVADEVGRKKAPFPLGLWIPRSALEETQQRQSEIREKLNHLDMTVATFNAFPMDVFHGQSVKEAVYRPDWSSKERLDYTISIGELAVHLGLEDVSISTVSGGFRPEDSREKIERYYSNWLAFVAWAIGAEERTGCCVRLALEPEPFNTLEDHLGTISLWSELRERASRKGIPMDLLDRHIGLCFDTCHFSVRFVEPLLAWKALEEAGVPVHKVQVSVAPRCTEIEKLHSFFELDEPVYLHQTFHRDQEGTIREYLDLNQASETEHRGGEWRTHFHVPIHWGDREDTTGHELLPLLRYLGTSEDVPTLEVETYSFDALPSFSEKLDLVSSIVSEMRWCELALSRQK